MANEKIDSKASIFDLAKGNADNVVAADPFWVDDGVTNGVRWNQSFPYQLMFVQRTETGGYSAIHTFTLPIPPESMSLSMPFAVNGYVTLDGYVEEHNGAPIRNISIRGTTGVMPLKGVPKTKLSPPNFANALFAGTVNAANRTAQQFKQLTVSESSALHKTNTIKSDELTPDSDLIKTSGYYQFRLLYRFLESYAALKKTKAGAPVRLAFAIWKDEAVYLVTPLSFDLSRSAQSPLEYTYGLNLRAWKRIKLDESPGSLSPAYDVPARKRSSLADILNKLDEARQTLNEARKTIEAVGADVNQNLFEPMREAVLFLKDSLGVPMSAGDLPDSIKKDIRGAADQFHSDIEKVAKAKGGDYEQASDQVKRTLTKDGRSENQTQTITNRQMVEDDLFANPDNYPDTFNEIDISTISMPASVRDQIEAERERTRNLSRFDFEKMRDKVAKTAADFTNLVGAGHPKFNETYNIEEKSTTHAPTDQDFDTMYALQESVMQFDKLCMSVEIEPPRPTTIEVVAGMARGLGHAFKVPRSKYAVPFPYGNTLEQVSARYLGNPNRWGEIAALNGLLPPYVDEVGFEMPLIANGQGNTVVVADVSKLHMNQSVSISSTAAIRTKRRITGIDKIGRNQYQLTLDGDPNLDEYVTLAQAKLHAFLPDTVNSQQMIYIPSDAEPTVEHYGTKSIPGVNEFDHILHAGGVDLLLTTGGDLVVTPDGDARLAIGMQNILQTVRTVLGVRKGMLNQHPDFGVALKPGTSIADLDINELAKTIRNAFSNDPTFSSVRAVTINQSGPTAKIAISVEIAGVEQLIPIAIEVQR